MPVLTPVPSEASYRQQQAKRITDLSRSDCSQAEALKKSLLKTLPPGVASQLGP
jgi:hypothetical protein